jgi:hypothetical protein
VPLLPRAVRRTLASRLIGLLTETQLLVGRVEAGAPTEEVDLRAHTVRATLDSLQDKLDVAPGPFDVMARHVYFIAYYHRKGQPEYFAKDVADLTESDLPAVIKAVEEGSLSGLDAGLVAAVGESWDAQHYRGAVRDGFVDLEDVLREVGAIDPVMGMSPDKLVTATLGPSVPDRGTRLSHSFLGDLTTGEIEGAYSVVKGAFC